jgi:hypothetical protein
MSCYQLRLTVHYEIIKRTNRFKVSWLRHNQIFLIYSRQKYISVGAQACYTTLVGLGVPEDKIYAIHLCFI